MRAGDGPVDMGLGMTGRADAAGTDGRRRNRGPFGPLEMLDDVQRQAVEAAMRVASELTALGGDLADPSPLVGQAGTGSGGDTNRGSDRPPIDVGRLRSDVGRTAETFSELMRALLDVGFDAIDELARRPERRPEATAAPEATAHLQCAIRNSGRDTVCRARPHVSQLVSENGTVLLASVAAHPDELDLDPHERVLIDLDFVISAEAHPGRYHGLLLVTGLTDAAYPITLEVRADIAGDHDHD